jgi:hypothetical protein
LTASAAREERDKEDEEEEEDEEGDFLEGEEGIAVAAGFGAAPISGGAARSKATARPSAAPALGTIRRIFIGLS